MCDYCQGVVFEIDRIMAKVEHGKLPLPFMDENETEDIKLTIETMWGIDEDGNIDSPPLPYLGIDYSFDWSEAFSLSMNDQRVATFNVPNDLGGETSCLINYCPMCGRKLAGDGDA